MGRVFQWLGIAAAIAIAALVIGGVLVARKGFTLDADANAYVESAVVAICGKWDQQQLIDRASPELLAAIQPGELAALFEKLSAAGPLFKYEGANGQATMTVYNGNSKIAAKYVAKALFAHGEGTIDISLVQTDGKWRILGFHVDIAAKPPDSDVQHI
jgi:hypothetical protein